MMNRLILFLVVCFMTACSMNTRISNKNLYYSYKKEPDQIHAEHLVYHYSNDSSKLYFKISSSELKYAEQNNSQVARLRISCKIYPSYESKTIIDTFNVVISDTATGGAHSILSVLPFKFSQGGTAILEVTIHDLSSQKTNNTLVHLDKTSNFTRQNFLAYKNEQLFPGFQNTYNTKDTLHIKSRVESPVLYVKYYNRDFPLPPPPFSEVDMQAFVYKPDSIFTIPNINGYYDLVISSKGFYHFQSDTAQKDGFTVFNFSEGYPELIYADQLVPPLRYITSRKEYEVLSTSPDKKQAVDEFWLKSGDNTTRARKILKTFYNRVQDANRYFTSYVEGWKTDRGLLYLIYGPPNTVFKNTDSETWIYGETGSVRSITFIFTKVNNPFTINDYSLNRSEAYKNSWYMAVDTWRQGRIYAE